MKYMLDICSGLGGASEAFQQDQEWEVVRLENNPLLEDVPGTMLVDILSPEFDYKALFPGSKFDFIWASPPCVQFSTAYGAPGPKARREGIDFKPDMRILEKCIEMIEHFNPKYWCIENVSGASKIFSRQLGRPPRQIVEAFYLWGVFPFLEMDPGWTHSKFEKDTWSDDPLRANKRGKVPLQISQAMLDSVSHRYQMSLEGWL
jgi:hypothetical protein